MTPISFGQPIWLLLGLPCIAALLLWRLPSRLLHALRIIVLLLVVLAVAEPALFLPSRIGTVVVVADRSRSMPEDVTREQLNAIQLIEGEMASGDRLAVVSFGADAVVERPPSELPFGEFTAEPNRDGSNLADALDKAVALIPRDAPGRVIVLSDGRWTGADPMTAAAAASVRETPIDFRMLERPVAGDVAIRSLDTPDIVASGESFTITAWLESPTPGRVEYELLRGDTIIQSGVREVGVGPQRIIFRDQAEQAGTQAYRLRVKSEGKDPVEENNMARRLVGVRGPRPILAVASEGESGFVDVLRSSGLQVEAKRPGDCRWDLESLSAYSCVLLENTPAGEVGVESLDLTAAWVREMGGGLMMTGGRNSYSNGGYFGSPLEPILPVSLELRQEHRKMSLALVIAMDRSGSMCAAAGGGKTKMDLANIGAAKVVEMLTPNDEIGVIAVDSSPHVIVNLQKVDAPGAIRSKVLKIGSMGGGIFVFSALSASAKMLSRSSAGARHIILFSDAADSEEPGQYRELLAQCEKEGITCSVIGLGTKADCDAKFLEDVAKRGGGRCYFTDRATNLPLLFAQDTFIVARTAFIEEPVVIDPTAGLRSLTGRSFTDPPPIGGYNLTYLRPTANIATVSVDENKAPIVASWQAGVGRVLCYTGQVDGNFTGAIAGWDEYGEFFSSLARWAAGRSNELPNGMMLTQEIRDGACRIRLHLDPELEESSIASLPKVATLRDGGLGGPATDHALMRWIDADTLGVDIPLKGDETAASVVDVGQGDPVALWPVCLPYSPEFEPVSANHGRPTLEEISGATGGVERSELPTIWSDLQRRPRRIAIGHWLLLAASILFLGEVFERRTGMLGSLPKMLLGARRERATVAQVAGEEATTDDDQREGLRGRVLGALRRWRYRRSIQKATQADAASRMADGATNAPATQAPPADKTPPEKKDSPGMSDALKRASNRAKGRNR